MQSWTGSGMTQCKQQQQLDTTMEEATNGQKFEDLRQVNNADRILLHEVTNSDSFLPKRLTRQRKKSADRFGFFFFFF